MISWKYIDSFREDFRKFSLRYKFAKYCFDEEVLFTLVIVHCREEFFSPISRCDNSWN